MSIDDHTSNINLIYEYAEKALKDIRTSSNVLNTKLGTVIGFDAVLIRFSSSLPDKSFVVDFSNTNLSCNCCLVLKILSYIALIVSLVFGLWGFKPQKGGEIILPEELMEKCLNISEEHYRRSIIENWNKSIKDLSYIRDKIAEKLSYAVFALGIATFLSAIDVVLASILE